MADSESDQKSDRQKAPAAAPPRFNDAPYLPAGLPDSVVEQLEKSSERRKRRKKDDDPIQKRGA